MSDIRCPDCGHDIDLHVTGDDCRAVVDFHLSATGLASRQCDCALTPMRIARALLAERDAKLDALEERVRDEIAWQHKIMEREATLREERASRHREEMQLLLDQLDRFGRMGRRFEAEAKGRKVVRVDKVLEV